MPAKPGRPDPELLSRAEQLLAGHRGFGGAGLIWRRASARLRFALEMLGERLPGAAGPLGVIAARECWPQVLRDPVVRMSTEAALQRLRRGQLGVPEDLEQVLGHAAGYAEPGDDRMPAQIEEGCGLRAGPRRQIWVLGFPASAGPLAGRLSGACTEHFIERAGRTGELNPGTSRTAALADQACDVLAALLPVLGPEVIGHVTALGTVTAQGAHGVMLSAVGGMLVPGTIVIAPGELERPWDAAGRILHEALHLKLFDISACSPLIAGPGSGTRVPWRPVPWELRRVLAAFHVYAHMVVFHAAVRARGDRLAARFGEPPANPGVSSSGNESYGRPQERLRFLGEQLTGPLAVNLTAAGRRFVSWQLDAIAPLAGWQPAPPPAAAPLDPARHDHPAAGYRHAKGITARPDRQAGSLLVFNSERGELYVTGLAAWAALELCDGRDLAALHRSYAGLVAGKLTAAAAASHLDATLAQLSRAGLIEPVTGQAASHLPGT